MPSLGFLARGIALGLAFGLAVGIVELAFVGVGFVQRRMGPGPVFLLQTVLLEMGLAGLLGLLTAPILALRHWRIPTSVLHLTVLALIWFALGRLAPFDAAIAALFQFVPLVAFVLAALGLRLGQRRAWLPWALGAVVLATAITVPQAYVTATTPSQPARATLPDPPPAAPDVVLVVLDTVRAPSLSTYGYDRETSPTLERLAAEGALFTDATSPSTWSLPSHASLFTGRYPSSHGAHGEHVFLDSTYPTLAQVLAANGYETFCFTSNAWISDGLGLTRGFSWQDPSFRDHGGAGRNFVFIYRFLDWLGLTEVDKGGALVVGNFAEWMTARPVGARPAFVFLNFIEAHFPYHQLPRDYLELYTERSYTDLREISMALMAQQFGGPVQETAEVRKPAIDMYDGGIVYTDELLRRVVEALRTRGTLDETVLVVLADHGEIMGEKGGFFGHGASLYQQNISVPLLVRYPPRIRGGVRVDQPVSTLGVFATIADLAGIPAPPTLQVPSLMPLLAGVDGSPGPVLSEKMGSQAMGGGDIVLPDPQMRGDTRYRAYRAGPLKLVETSSGDTFLYDLASDPTEAHDLSRERPGDLERLQDELEAVRVALQLPHLNADLTTMESLPELDDATIERLRALGYVE